MSLPYHLIPKLNPNDLYATQRYYASAKTRGIIDLKKLSKYISMKSTFTPADIIGVLESLVEEIPRQLALGYVVQLGSFGNFRLTIHSEGVEDPRTFTSRNIKNVKMVYKTGNSIKQMLKETHFEKIKKKKNRT